MKAARRRRRATTEPAAAQPRRWAPRACQRVLRGVTGRTLGATPGKARRAPPPTTDKTAFAQSPLPLCTGKNSSHSASEQLLIRVAHAALYPARAQTAWAPDKSTEDQLETLLAETESSLRRILAGPQDVGGLDPLRWHRRTRSARLRKPHMYLSGNSGGDVLGGARVSQQQGAARGSMFLGRSVSMLAAPPGSALAGEGGGRGGGARE